MPCGRNQPAHQADQLRREQRVLGAFVDAVRDFFTAPDVDKPDIPQLVREDTLRERARDSTGPGRGIGEDLGRQILVHNDVREGEAASGPQNPVDLREDA